MPKTWALPILAILLVLVALWNFLSPAETEEVSSSPTGSSFATEESPPPPPRTPVRTTPLMTPALTPAAPARTPGVESQDLSELRQRLITERQKLETRTQALQKLKVQQQSLGDPQAYRSQIERRDLEIQNLEQVLAEYRAAEEDLSRTAGQALQNQEGAARVARDQVEMQIQQNEDRQRQLKADLNYLQNISVGRDVSQVRAESEQLQKQISDLETELNALRAQRVNISAGVLGNSQEVQVRTEQARNDLRAAAAQAQEQIFFLRSQMDQLREGQYRAQAQGAFLQSRIAQEEEALQAQQQQVEELQRQIRSRE